MPLERILSAGTTKRDIAIGRAAIYDELDMLHNLVSSDPP